jgi:hypothetical protein
MVLAKVLVIGILMVGLIGSTGLFVLANATDLKNDARDLIPHWGRGGGCRGGSYGVDNDRGYSSAPPCHDADEAFQDGYCSYHDEYFTGEGWEDHREECPFYNDTLQQD